jgi:hypothetical protein
MVRDRCGRRDGPGGVLRGLSPGRPRSSGARAVDDGGVVDVLLRDRGAVLAADRTALRRGHRRPGDRGKPGSGSHDDLALSSAPRGWLREAKRHLEDQRAQEAKPIPAARPARLKEAKRRLDEELWTECQANAAYEAYRAPGPDEGRLAVQPPARPVHPSHDADRQGQPHRPPLAQRQDLTGMAAGLQRAGRDQHGRSSPPQMIPRNPPTPPAHRLLGDLCATASRTAPCAVTREG